MCEDNTYNVMNHIVKAHFTFTFQFPKLAFIFADTSQYVGEWEILDIGIRIPESENFNTDYILTCKDDINGTLKKRNKYAHKGTMGHASLVAGKKGMAGAAILSSKACMRTGVGKLTLHTQECNALAITTSIPEVVLDIEHKTDFFCRTFDATPFDAMAIGPGIGTDNETALAFIEQVRHAKIPLLIDADGLNILGSHKGWMQQVPRESILTPHPLEMRRMGIRSETSFSTLDEAIEMAMRYKIYIILKGHHTAVCTPEGKVYFNTTGNHGMATAGCGDVLTGVILSFLAQKYSPLHACLLGVFLHGRAGDYASMSQSQESMIASDIIDNLHLAFNSLKSLKKKNNTTQTEMISLK
jgi:NAD(P)H-hydrate epimerase